MKKIICCFPILLILLNSSAQNVKSNSYSLAKVKNWGSLTMWIIDEGWAGIKDQVIKQVGPEMFEDIKAHYDYKSIPPQMSLYDGHHKRDLDEYNKKLDGLKVCYKVATYDYVFRGTDYGKYDILMVPYKGNEEWDASAKWDTVYLIVPDKDVATN